MLLKEALICFRKAENELINSSSASLDVTDKARFIEAYRQIASEVDVKLNVKQEIKSFLKVTSFFQQIRCKFRCIVRLN